MKLSRKIGLSVVSCLFVSLVAISSPNKPEDSEGLKWRVLVAKTKGKALIRHSDIYRLVSKSKGRCRKSTSLKVKKGVTKKGRIIVTLGFFNYRKNQPELRRALSIVSTKCAPLESKTSARSSYYA